MKSGLLALNILLLVAVGYLFIEHFGPKKNSDAGTSFASRDLNNDAVDGEFKMAYFEMDSIEANFKMVKDVKAELSRKEASINSELEKMDKTYREKVNDYQQKARAQTLSQVQSEMATQDLMTIQDQMKSRKQALDQEYNDFMMRRMKDVKSRIENFLKEYNKSKHYSYIVSYEQGLFYYKDTSYNITSDIIKGLNELYKPGKD